MPTIKDRVAQMAAVLVLEPVFEADLQPEQYAYRPGRSAVEAVRQVHALLSTGHTEVVDADLSGYFDSIPHGELLKSVSRRISDRHVLRLIKMWLDAPVEEIDDRGRHHRTTRNQDEHRGCPQGAPVSPLLSNLYMRRFILGWRTLGHQQRLGARIVNYADDFVICCRGTAEEAIAIDGKACRAAPGDTFSGCLHLVSAWATENGLILGQEAVADNGHEITTIPVLLEALDLKGAVVTIDAAGCQKAIVEQIRVQGGDYLVTVKGNQQTLHRAVVAAFEKAGETAFAGCDMAASVEDGHGRHEERYVTVIAEPGGLPAGWPDVGAIVVVGREREAKGKNASTWHFYLTSLRATAAELGGYVRGHWDVENGLHWCLDIAFREDENRTRDTNAGANLGVVRRVAASLLKQDTKRGSIKAKRMNAAWDPNYLARVLQGFKAD